MPHFGLRKVRGLLLAVGLCAAPAAAQMRLPAPLPPMSPAPPPYGQDAISSGIPERVAALRAAVPDALRSGAIQGPAAQRLALILARMERQLRVHVPRSYGSAHGCDTGSTSSRLSSTALLPPDGGTC